MIPRPRVWITRAEPGASLTAARLAAWPVEPVIAPLIRIEPVAASRPDMAGFDGLIFTSANGVAAFMEQHYLLKSEALLALPVFSVGETTARAARMAGFTSVKSADGDVVALAHLIRLEAAGMRLLHPCALQPAGDLAGEVRGVAEVQPLAVYQSVSSDLDLPDDFDLVLIHSPRAARELAMRLPLVQGRNQANGRIVVAISEAAVLPLRGMGFAALHTAETPDEAGLLNALTAALGKPPAGV